jgi:EpsD family peptidyl-prolyl cis-trans isomerase
MKTPELMHSWTVAICFITSATILTACGNQHGNSSPTQVAAKVGPYEITQLQINNAVRTGQVSSVDLAVVKNRALEKLVDEQLLVARAEQLKLDRSPQVLGEIDEAKRQIIARAYLEQLSQQQAQPNKGEIHAYYQSHPELFGERRIYTVRTLTIPVAQFPDENAENVVLASKSIEQLLQVLKGQGIRYSSDSGERGPETMPFDLIPRVAEAKDGSLLTGRGDGSLYALQIISSRPAPVTEEQADPAIQRFLMNQRARTAVSEELERLRAATKVEYFGGFGPVVAKAETVATPSTAPAASSGAMSDDTIKSGFKGIK